MIERLTLEDLYAEKRLSMQEVASQLDCSVHKVVYYMDKYGSDDAL
jgi:DNA-binding CsgD family transcriptional regulator